MKKFLLTPLLALACAGCVQYSSHIRIGQTEFLLPKDATFSWLQASVPIMISNGVVASASITITNGSFKMNPVVIDKVTQHDIAIIGAAGQVIGQVTAAAIQGAK